MDHLEKKTPFGTTVHNIQMIFEFYCWITSCQLSTTHFKNKHPDKSYSLNASKHHYLPVKVICIDCLCELHIKTCACMKIKPITKENIKTTATETDSASAKMLIFIKDSFLIRNVWFTNLTCV